ncbi:endonuclease III domain-containing protein [Limnoglobus roseus]|uniref:Endonuclease III n=1 Tax=Limnoglobus roseus TaxID=2598579 RepID=A0A5C1A924_9BACT|nr:endonuclease [Limnoglobus roseus]QEL14546.1 Endonuclease III [Limnoglobus roseus]
MLAIMNKQDLLTKSIKVLDKKFPPAADPVARPVLEEVLYAVVREGTTTEQANAVFAKMKGTFFDWNEVRVSTVPEIADAIAGVPDASRKAQRINEILHYVFEMYYSFELTDLDKKGLKQAGKQLGRFTGMTDFGVAWVIQRALGGHAIPLDEPTIRALRRLGIIEGEGEVEDLEAVRTSLEHYIPKSSGPTFTDRFSTLAVTICQEKPKCPDCPLRPDCPTGQEYGKKVAPEPKPKPKSR